jgi:hypothetical protein
VELTVSSKSKQDPLIELYNSPGLTRKTSVGQLLHGILHDQGDAKWIVIRRHLWGHNDTPFGLAALRAYLVFSVFIEG